MASLRYSPLDSLKKEIRLLCPLLRQRPDQPAIGRNGSSAIDLVVTPDLSLVFELQVVSINDEPVYTALSYVWGGVEDLKPITVNGSSFLVTRNLNDALQHISFEDIAPSIWIDSICIDQNNYIEKTEQLQLVGTVYSNAVRVLVWLGLPTENSDVLAEVVLKFAKNVRRRFNVPSSPKYDLVDYIEYDLESEIYEDVNAAIQTVGNQDLVSMTAIDFIRAFMIFICGREWWYRVWVLQEFVLAKQVQFQVGLRRIGLQELATFLLASAVTLTGSILQRGLTDSQSLSSQFGWDWLMYMLSYRERRHQKSKIENGSMVFELLCTTYCRPAWRDGGNYSLKATDERDQIYGLVSLFQDYKSLGLTVDYRKTWQDIYSEVAQKLIQAGYLDILAFCQAKCLSNDAGLPSWDQPIQVPNAWFKTSGKSSKTVLGNSLFAAASTSKALATFSMASNADECSAQSMQITGVFVDEVMEIKSTYLRSNATTSFHRQLLLGKLFREIQHLCKQSERLGLHTYTAASLRDAAWKMPVFDHELDGAGNDGDGKVQRATKITLDRYQACLPLFKGIEAYMREEEITSQSHKAFPIFSSLRFLRASFYRIASRFFFFLFTHPQHRGTRFQRLCSRLKLIPALFRAVQDPMITFEPGMTQELNIYLMYMEGGRPMKPFITKTGYIGLGPMSIQPNDTVCIFLGARVPHILRRRQNGQNGYLFVGETFVYGLMDGEVMKEGYETRDFEVF
ncbi:hypothetical protein MMC11_000195 [Xylographa trunciseda]|nr:hypothetical protein [Xylographa trunciseda]